MSSGRKKSTFFVIVPSHFKTDNKEIQKVIAKIQKERPVEEQQKHIKILSEYVLKHRPEAEYVSSLLCHIFLTSGSNSTIKKTLWRTFINAEPDIIVKAMSVAILYVMDECMKESNPTKLCENKANVIINFSSCFDNFPAAIVALSDLNEVLISFTVEHFIQLVTFYNSETCELPKDIILNYLLTVSKFLLCLLQQCKVTAKLRKFADYLLTKCQQVVLSESILLDLRANCAFIMTIVIDYLPKSVKTKFMFKVYPCLELVKTENTCQYDVSNNSTAMVCIYAAIMNTVPQEVLCETTYNNMPILVHIFEQLITLSKSFSAKPAQILLMSRALTSLSRMLNGIPLKNVEHMFMKALEYVWIYLDHYVEHVRHSTRIVFQNFTKLAVKYYREGNPLLFEMIQLSILDLLLSRHTHYIALTILSAEVGCEILLKTFENLPYLLLNNLKDPTIALPVCNTYESLMEQYLKEEGNVALWIAKWIAPIIKLLKISDLSSATSSYQRIIKHAFQIEPFGILSTMQVLAISYDNFLEVMFHNSTLTFLKIHFQHTNEPNELNALLECLRLARKKNIHITFNENENSSNLWRNYIEYDTIDRIMCHQSDEVRISLLGLIVETHKSTETLTTYELNFLLKFFEYNVTTQEPYMRQDLLALYKKALIRMKESYALLNKFVNSNEEITENVINYKNVLKSYDSFYEKFMCHHIKSGLSKDSNFYRRSICLELIILMRDIVSKTTWDSFWYVEDYTNIYNVFYDPYESNLALISKLVNMLSGHKYGKEMNIDIEDRLKNFFQTACSLQPADTTRAAYLLLVHLRHPKAAEMLLNHIQNPPKYKTVYELAIFVLMAYLEEQIKVAESNLILGIVSTPFYGLLLAIRHILEETNIRDIDCWQQFVSQIFSLCARMSAIVAPIINNSSPEGYIPEQTINGIEIGNNDKSLAQKVLLFGWRSTKEMSLLIGEIMEKSPNYDPGSNELIFTIELINKAEAYFLKLFFETKHRGAYEQAYVGFCKFCKKLWEICANGYVSYPEKWLEHVLKLLTGEIQENENLCATRRSAGLPFMLQAILVSEPKNRNTNTFQTCMDTLLTVAENTTDENNKSRTHALNILRALFKHNQLNERVVPYVPRGFIVAINGFDDSNWSIRNSSTLLYAALITRAFGVQRTKDIEEVSIKNKMSGKVFFTRYPGLHDFLLERLKKFEQTPLDHHLSIHPVLLILSRLYASNSDEEKQLVEYLPYISYCLSQPSYRTRELAAKASVSILPKRDVKNSIRTLLKTLSNVNILNNHCHAILLQLKYLLQTNVPELEEERSLPNIIENTFWIFIRAGQQTSHFTASLYFDVIALLTQKYPESCFGSRVFKKMSELLLVESVYEDGRLALFNNTAKSIYDKNRYFLHIHLVTNLRICDPNITVHYLKELLFNGLTSNVNEINEFALNYLIYVNQESSTYKLRHALYITEEIEICKYVKRTADSLTQDRGKHLMQIMRESLSRQFRPIFNNLIEKSPIIRHNVFLLLYEYPSLLEEIDKDKKNVLNFLLKYIFKDGDILYCAVLGCISKLIEGLDSKSKNGLRPFNFKPIIRILLESSLPNVSLCKRLTTSQFIVDNKHLLLHNHNILDKEEKLELWDIVILLLEDYDRIVREIVSDIVTKKVNNTTSAEGAEVALKIIPEKAREIIVELIPEVLDPCTAIRVLISWALRNRKRIPTNNNLSEDNVLDGNGVFDTVEINPFAEDEPLAYLASKTLKNFLWKLGDGLCYSDYSIFIEEHALLIATKVRNAMYSGPLPMLENHLRCTLIHIMRKMMEYLENREIGKANFKLDLELELISVIMRFTFDKESEDDRSRLKYVMRSIFGLV